MGDFLVEPDYSIGRILNALKVVRLSEDILVFFSSHNDFEHYGYARDK